MTKKMNKAIVRAHIAATELLYAMGHVSNKELPGAFRAFRAARLKYQALRKEAKE